ncbi:MAG: phosphatidylglycerol lysyltransferase domain-containing protein [Treponema sp.]|nr:phosphatidylglycerol lysyltransferase domain-containing protein [Treponema sp.]
MGRGFLPAGPESYPLFRDFKSPAVLSELTPAVSTFWTLSFNELYRIIDGCLVTVFFFDGMEPYFEVKLSMDFCSGETGAALPRNRLRGLIETLYDLALGASLPRLHLYAVEECFLEQFTGVDGFTVEAGYSDDHSEYIYKPADVVDLSGGINHKKHTHLNKFLDRPGISLIPLDNANRRLFLEVEREWCGSQDCGLCSAFAGCELRALEIMGEIYDERYFHGLLAYAEDKLSGYLVWEQREEGRAYLHFGKGTIQNLFVYLIYLLARDKLGGGDSTAAAAAPPPGGGVRLLNINEDMGKEGLRRFKRHLGPYEHWRKYLCTYVKNRT